MYRKGLFLYLGIGLGILSAQNPLGSLKTVKTPEPENLYKFLKSDGSGNGGITLETRKAAIALGKALFWDQAVGSDGQACASCHYSAGADTRTYNQIDSGLRAIPPDPAFTSPFGPEYQLHQKDFPLFRPKDGDTNDVVSSQGVFDKAFVSIAGPCPADQPNLHHCDSGVYDPTGVSFIFAPGRNVEPRNTPTIINAVFNFRNFWDLRARNEFNGVDPIGDLDPFAKVWIIKGGSLQLVRLKKNAFGPETEDLRLENASLASQAVGPALSDMEMSYRGRSFPELGRKMLALERALPDQHVAPNDSFLGPYSRGSDPGLSKTYPALIKAAFQSRWWDGGVLPDPNPSKFTQMEANFSLFWGLAIQMYEATLRADDSPFDKAFDSGNPMTYTSTLWGDQQKLGLQLFQGKGKCVNCHGGPETTNASVRYITNEKLSRMPMGNNQCAVYDEGIYNTAVRKCAGDRYGNPAYGLCDDGGLGVTIGPLDLPLSTSRFFQLVVAGDPKVAPVCAEIPEACIVPDVHVAPGCSGGGLLANEPIAVVGAFKTAGLRNIEIQAPYFHNGGDLNLASVLKFYDRGGNFPQLNQANLDPDIVDLGLNSTESAAIASLLIAMTDERVRCRIPPFDHPEITVPHVNLNVVGGGASTTDTIPAYVGDPNGKCLPLPTFSQNLAKP